MEAKLFIIRRFAKHLCEQLFKRLDYIACTQKRQKFGGLALLNIAAASAIRPYSFLGHIYLDY
jgi:hypothetical protein